LLGRALQYPLTPETVTTGVFISKTVVKKLQIRRDQAAGTNHSTISAVREREFLHDLPEFSIRLRFPNYL
jgi:hypothetical protein